MKMRISVSAASLGLVVLAATKLTTASSRNEADDHDGQEHRRGISFNIVDTSPLPFKLLQTVDGFYGGSDRIECTPSTESDNVASYSCGTLTDGVPVVYTDEDGALQCFCTCEAGSEVHADAVDRLACLVVEPETVPCVWNTHPFGFKRRNTAALETCTFSRLATDWHVPVPTPSGNSDNCSATDVSSIASHRRIGARVDVVVTRFHTNAYAHHTLVSLYENFHPGRHLPRALPPEEVEMLNVVGQGMIPTVHHPEQLRGFAERTHYSWADYQHSPQTKIDEIVLTAYGKYEIALDARDCTNDRAQCVGCVAVVDAFRPKHTTACPVGFSDNSLHASNGIATAELTQANVEKANQLVAAFYDFPTLATNDACRAARCDRQSFLLKDFFENEFTDHGRSFRKGAKCFAASAIDADFAASEAAQLNPLEVRNDYGMVTSATQADMPVPAGHCTRCCQFETQLQEHWTDYTCGYEYDLTHCSGDDGESCAFQQCLVLFGDAIATVTASIRPEVTAESERVLASTSINTEVDDLQTYTQIHRALQCSSFGSFSGNAALCNYAARLSDLVDVSETNTFGNASHAYTFWRYKVAGDDAGWRLWDVTADQDQQVVHTFDRPETKVTLEAWTACGLARKFFFYVHLHLQTDVAVCDSFRHMWTQPSIAIAYTNELPSRDLCVLPGSDYAELTFRYEPKMGLLSTREGPTPRSSGVVCQLAFQDRAPIEIVNVVADSPTVTQHYAVQLIKASGIAGETRFSVSCTLSYARDDAPIVQQTCPMDFAISDCGHQTMDVTSTGECDWQACDDQTLAGPFEVCGGKLLRADAKTSYLDARDRECCQGCGTSMPFVCAAVLNGTKASELIKRCVPQALATKQQQLSMRQAAPAQDQRMMPHSDASSWAIALYGVAVVLVVYVARKRLTASGMVVDIEAVYQPLVRNDDAEDNTYQRHHWRQD